MYISDLAYTSLHCWVMELHEFPESRLKEDMEKFGVRSIMWVAPHPIAHESTEMRFPASFPHEAPFMRILHPRCLQFMAGGGGNVTA